MVLYFLTPFNLSDRPISQWDVSSAKNMSGMFMDASAFNQNVTSWELDSAVDVSRMFYNAASFKQDLCAWQATLPPDASVVDMFVGTACPSEDDPNLANSPVQPLCAKVCTAVDDKPSPNTKTPVMAPTEKMTSTDMPSVSIQPSSSEVPSSSDAPSASEMPASEGNTTEPIGRFKCFDNNEELGEAVREYVKDPSRNSSIALMYGWPIAKWCVDKVTSMDSIFKGQASFSKFDWTKC